MKKQLFFCFKGNRGYVQGPDIVSALLKEFSDKDIKNIDLKFNGITATELDLIEGLERADAKVNIRLLEDSVEKSYQLIENGQQINCRYEYDENKIIEKTAINIDKQGVSLTDTTGFTFCENFVAMNKHLLQSIYPDEKGKWYFTRLELTKPIDNNSLIEVKLVKNFNFRLTKSDILLNDNPVGSVYFSMVRS